MTLTLVAFLLLQTQKAHMCCFIQASVFVSATEASSTRCCTPWAEKLPLRWTQAYPEAHPCCWKALLQAHALDSISILSIMNKIYNMHCICVKICVKYFEMGSVWTSPIPSGPPCSDNRTEMHNIANNAQSENNNQNNLARMQSLVCTIGAYMQTMKNIYIYNHIINWI